MVDTLEIIRTIANVISAAAIVVAARQLLLARRQFKLQLDVWESQHERARREKAIEIIRIFNQSLTAQWSSTHKLVEHLDEKQLKALDDGQPFSVVESEKHDLQAALPGATLSVNKGNIDLTSEQSYQLRYQALDVLNAAEIVFQAWDRDIADPKIIEQEMRFLYEPDDPQPITLMRKYRNVFQGEKYYPVLYKFIRHVDAVRNGAPQPPQRLTNEARTQNA